MPHVTHDADDLSWARGAVTLGFWFLSSQSSTWVLYALYAWTGVFATLVIVRFWILAGDLFTVSQAKRLRRADGLRV